MHRTVVENQKNQFEMLMNNLSTDSCILILGFKENFKVTERGNQKAMIITIKGKYLV